jgi:hypothetical protein
MVRLKAAAYRPVNRADPLRAFEGNPGWPLFDESVTQDQEETAVPQENRSAEKRKKDERDAKVLWYLMMALRVVIPAYMLYVVYLYWTMPLSPYLQGPR